MVMDPVHFYENIIYSSIIGNFGSEQNLKMYWLTSNSNSDIRLIFVPSLKKIGLDARNPDGFIYLNQLKTIFKLFSYLTFTKDIKEILDCCEFILNKESLLIEEKYNKRVLTDMIVQYQIDTVLGLIFYYVNSEEGTFLFWVDNGTIVYNHNHYTSNSLKNNFEAIVGSLLTPKFGRVLDDFDLLNNHTDGLRKLLKERDNKEIKGEE